MIQKQLPGYITTVMAIMVALMVCIAYFYESGWKNTTDTWNQFLGAVAFLMGMMNLLRLHSSNIKKKRAHWIFSVWLLAVMIAFFIYGIRLHHTHENYQWWYTTVVTPVNQTVYAMCAFYIVSAAFKAFRVKNIEAAILMFCACFVMLSNVPIGDAIWSADGWLGGFAGIRDWLVSIPNAASSRAIGFGIFLGAIATRLRLFLGVEKRHLGELG